MNIGDWVLVLLTVGGGGAMLSAGIGQLQARRRCRREERTLACPRTGGAVNCELLVDERTGQCMEANRCSRSGGGPPTCEQHCVKLLNLGIPLTPGEDAPTEQGRHPSPGS